MIYQPLITVFIPVYNSERFLNEAINSILEQSYTNLEILVLDDGSTDNSLAILEKYYDPRIRIIRNTENKGISYTRNLGVRQARGIYLALLDSDDVAVPDRLTNQVAFMEANPHVSMCGGHAISIDENGLDTGRLSVPIGEEEPSGLLMFCNPFVNSTLMFRLDTLKSLEGYYAGLCEDYELSVRINEAYPIANIDKVLTKYRIYSTNTSNTKKKEMLMGERNVIGRIFSGLGIKYNEFMIHLYHDVFFGQASVSDKATIKDYYKLFSSLKKANNERIIYSKEVVNARIFLMWYEKIRQSRTNMALYYLFKAPLFDVKYLTFKMIRKAFKQSFGIL